jgi:hypothetical protein
MIGQSISLRAGRPAVPITAHPRQHITVRQRTAKLQALDAVAMNLIAQVAEEAAAGSVVAPSWTPIAVYAFRIARALIARWLFKDCQSHFCNVHLLVHSLSSWLAPLPDRAICH